jgi:phosphorylcholine metabolism protein LicD
MILIILAVLILLIFYYFYYNYFLEKFVPIEVLTDYKQIKQNINLMKKFIDFTDKYKLEYWAIGGTLLGAVRDRAMIVWDDDLDVSMKEQEVEKLLNLRNILNTEYDLGISEWFGGYKIFENTGISVDNFKYPFIDVFPMITDENNDFIYKSEKCRELWPDIYKKELTYPLKKYQFEDLEIWGPNQAEPLLDKFYKDWRIKGLRAGDHSKQKQFKRLEFSIDYDLSKKPFLWLYWDNINNNKTPVYIDLCYETVVKNCSQSFNVVRLNKDNIKKYLPELDEYEKYLDKLIIAHKVDFYRIMLLYKYGGLYLDSDMIVLRDPVEIIDKLKKYDYVGFGCTGGKCTYGYKQPSNWAMASRPTSILMANVLNNLIDKITKKYKENNYNTQYHELGKEVIWSEINKLIDTQNYEYFHYPNKVDGSRDKNGNWIYNDIIFSDTNIDYDDEQNMLFFTMYNSGVSDDIKKMSRDELLNMKCNYSKFLKKALKL